VTAGEAGLASADSPGWPYLFAAELFIEFIMLSKLPSAKRDQRI
jgi:hypothetical protein